MKGLFHLFKSVLASWDATPQDRVTMSTVPQAKARSLTVLELFQSQGCSSCPPTNANVLDLADDPNVLVLTYEITYWDYLGWKDTFGHSAWDRRQREYSRAWNRQRLFTPQVIVNGSVDSVGNKASALAAMIAQGTKGGSSVEAIRVIDGGVTVEGADGAMATVLLVTYEPRPADVSIRAGENGGRTIPHRNVVCAIMELGTWRGGSQSFALPRPTIMGGERAIVLQSGLGGPIVGAARE
ncbi:MAG: hypothetical protein M1838_004610 [Thelocarpon superellum]|nr:MAG: hypothetical protein M1838_004610 [Thelocarpon superellum]